MSSTLAIIKPDAVKNGAIGDILMMAEHSDFEILDLKFTQLSEAAAGRFYAEHAGKPFYDKLVKFMASGPCVAVWLTKDNGDAVVEWRKLVKEIREVEASKEYSERNAVHGSDSPESARRELYFFFPEG